MSPIRRSISVLLAVLLLLSTAPHLAFATEYGDPMVTLGTFSADMLSGGGRQIQTDKGLYYVGAEDGWLYCLDKGSEPVLEQQVSCLNYEDGKLWFARQGEGLFDLCSYDLASGEVTVVLDSFSGTVSQLYLVDGSELWFMSEHTVWRVSVPDGALSYVFYAEDLWSFVPTGCGMIYACGSLFNYSLYAGDHLIAEHVESYFVDFSTERPLLVYTIQSQDFQLTLLEAFTGSITPKRYAGMDQTFDPNEPEPELILEPEEEQQLASEEEEAALRARLVIEELISRLPQTEEEEPAEPAEEEPVEEELTEEEAFWAETPAPEAENPEEEPTDEEPEEYVPTCSDMYPDDGLDYEIVQLLMPEEETEIPDTDGENLRRPLSAGIQNIVRRAKQMLYITWRPLKDVAAWEGRMIYKAGKTYTGLPYGQPVNASYVPWSTSLPQFIACVNNSQSKMYTARSTYYKDAPYYSIDCSAFVSWAWNLRSRQHTGGLPNYGTRISSTSYANIQVGDCLNSSGHAVLVTDVTYDATGAITGIQISEATPATADDCCCRSVNYVGDRLAAFRQYYFGNGYTIYRSKTRDEVTYTHECVVPLEGDTCPLCGEGMFFKPGIDVSEHDGEIDWDKAAPYIDFAIIRVSDGGGEKKHEDVYFDRNVQACERLGIPYGVYIYAEAITAEEAMQEADYVLSRIQNYHPTLPIFYDVEEKKTIFAESMTNEKILECVSTFCQTIEDVGFHAGVYASTSPWNNRLTSKVYDQWCCWAAQYNELCNIKVGAHLWQYSSNGTVPGIKTRVDMNYWFGQVGSEDHRFTATKTPATCATDGSLTYTCTECGMKVSKTIASEGHNFVNGFCTVCGKEETVLDQFWDVSEGAWYSEAIEYTVVNNLLNGTSSRSFSPQNPMNRGMIVTVLWRLAGSPEPENAARFEDLIANKYYVDAVAWASEYGVVTGITDTLFAPDNEVTREQVATLLYRFAGERTAGDELADLSVFPDEADAASYARTALSWAVAKGIVTGTSKKGVTTLNPKGRATRAQVAVMIMRYAELMQDKNEQ